jgi:hypothetical protein
MVEKEITAGSISTTIEEKKKLAKNSISETFGHPEILPLFLESLCIYSS